MSDDDGKIDVDIVNPNTSLQKNALSKDTKWTETAAMSPGPSASGADLTKPPRATPVTDEAGDPGEGSVEEHG
jgi:hypothetical protein